MLSSNDFVPKKVLCSRSCFFCSFRYRGKFVSLPRHVKPKANLKLSLSESLPAFIPLTPDDPAEADKSKVPAFLARFLSGGSDTNDLNLLPSFLRF